MTRKRKSRFTKVELMMGREEFRRRLRSANDMMIEKYGLEHFYPELEECVPEELKGKVEFGYKWVD